MKNQILTLAAILLFFASCSSPQQLSSNKTTSNQHQDNGLNSSLNAVLWQQNAAEYDALCYQAYNAAIDFLGKTIAGNTDMTVPPTAVIMDLDETVLNNSPYYAQLIISNEKYSLKSWHKWVELSKANLVPGAKEFIDFARSNDIKVIYISNRSIDMLEPTMRNLQSKGIDVNPEDIILKHEISEKLRRREMVSEAYNIVMLVGDNLADLNTEFEKNLENEEHKRAVYGMASNFGRKLIVLPNAMYGGWYDKIEEQRSKADDGVTNPSLKGYY